MKKILVVLLAVLLSTGFAFAEGGKNQGSSGKGSTSTGTDTQGAAEQSRAGR